ncbi:GroES-like protein [Camillea tinctor]|nr:GroES-like protein [Camillea tinctor]
MERDKALYVDANSQFAVRPAGTHEPADNELLIEVQYSGINPADVKHATHLGIVDTVLGYDFCGCVVRTPPKGSGKFSVGDTVAGYTPTSMGRSPRHGTHQPFLCCPEDMCFAVPEAALPRPHAAALTTVAMTAADAIYNLFGTPLPTAAPSSSPPSTPKPLLIWGAASSVGLCALQFAAASQLWFPILATASPSRHALLRRLGATAAFDYRSPSVVQDIRSAVAASGLPLAHALDAVGAAAGPVAQCADDPDDPEKTVLVSATFQPDARFRLPLALQHRPFHIRLPGPEAREIVVPPKPEPHWRAWEALRWAVGNYRAEGEAEGGFRLPEVRVERVGAEEALELVKGVAEGRTGFGKVVIEHRIE